MKAKKLRVKKTVVRSLTRNELDAVNGGRWTWSSSFTGDCAASQFVCDPTTQDTGANPHTVITCPV